MRFIRLCSAFLLLTIAVCAQQAQPLHSVAISDFQLNGIDSAQGAALTDALATELKNTGRFRVMERSQMDKVLQEQGFQQSGVCDNSNCAIQVGQLLSIDAMVIGSISQVGGTLALNARLVDVGSGEVQVALNRNSSLGFADMLDNVVPQMAKGLADPQGPYGIAYKPEDSSARALSTDQGFSWWPWVAGGAVAIGGVILAIVLTGDEDDTTAAPASSTETQLHFTW